MRTYKIVDNTGALEAREIRVLKKSKADIGDIVVVSISKVLPNKKLKKGEIHYGLVISTREGLVRSNGIQLKMDQNRIVLITMDKGQTLLPIGSRIQSPLPIELMKHKKVFQLANHSI